MINLLAAIGTIAAVWTNIYFYKKEHTLNVIIYLKQLYETTHSEKNWNLYVTNLSYQVISVGLQYIRFSQGNNDVYIRQSSNGDLSFPVLEKGSEFKPPLDYETVNSEYSSNTYLLTYRTLLHALNLLYIVSDTFSTNGPLHADNSNKVSKNDTLKIFDFLDKTEIPEIIVSYCLNNSSQRFT
ncbi:hypothetical protein [Lactobacillus sp. ESL0703]|uniref:hypothetical protein n=1 Tax=Lactobacillus sp. ESL0703 TaxID=2983218 RepID=UPI0023F638D1|nr:hypothetical protein [Lactobacillus sp. ESL0703]MDF7668498.1 hypothetical protein [Lactobacillus sp. ESL0703]